MFPRMGERPINRIIRPQKGPQENLLSCDADIAFFGGAAGGGKSFACMLDYLRHYPNPRATGILFRRHVPQITKPGSLWDASFEIYPMLGAKPNNSNLTWKFPSGSKITFTHLTEEKTVYDYQGAEIAAIYFDELTHFTSKQFWYMLSRNRTTSGIKPYMRATMNPVPDGWIRDLLEWWIDPDGLPIKERSGVKRYFYRTGDEIHWSTKPEELKQKFPELAKLVEPMSFTFIPSLLQDNQILMDKDPSYKAKLMSLPRVDRERLLFGNWNVRESAGTYFKREYFEIVEPNTVNPKNIKCRFWDRAGTSGEDKKEKREMMIDPETASLLLSLDVETGMFYIEHCTHDMLDPPEVVNKIDSIVKSDGPNVTIALSQDPGQAGKFELEFYLNRFAMYHTWTMRETGSKESRAKPASARAEREMIKLVRGSWNEAFLKQAENFPEGRKDLIDALSGALSYFIENKIVTLEIYGESGVKSQELDSTTEFKAVSTLGDDLNFDRW